MRPLCCSQKKLKRMLPKVMKKLVYIRYEKKISVSEEELKKGTEKDGANGHDVGVLDEDLAK